MTISDPIADMLTKIRNSILIKKKEVVIGYSKIKEGIIDAFLRLGFISNYEVFEETNRKYIKVFLKYVNRKPVIEKIIRNSKPSCREYTSLLEIKKKKAYGIEPQHAVFILSTSKGVLSKAEAQEKGIGGEKLCTIW